MFQKQSLPLCMECRLWRTTKKLRTSWFQNSYITFPVQSCDHSLGLFRYQHLWPFATLRHHVTAGYGGFARKFCWLLVSSKIQSIGNNGFPYRLQHSVNDHSGQFMTATEEVIKLEPVMWPMIVTVRTIMTYKHNCQAQLWSEVEGSLRITRWLSLSLHLKIAEIVLSHQSLHAKKFTLLWMLLLTEQIWERTIVRACLIWTSPHKLFCSIFYPVVFLMLSKILPPGL